MASPEIEQPSQPNAQVSNDQIQRLPELLRTKGVVPFFQPIVRLSDGAVVGHEVLGRGTLPGLPANPIELFRIAAAVGKEVELSEAFRRASIEAALRLGIHAHMFLNTHPFEIKTKELVDSLKFARELLPEISMTLEIDEAAIEEIDELGPLASALKELKIALAFDDFGAGEARLGELAQVSPGVIKFKMALIRDIDKAPSEAQQSLGRMVALSRAKGITTLALGIERKEEADGCRSIGFELAQGYLFGRPAPTP